MKRNICPVVLSGILALTFSACGSTITQTESQISTETEKAATTENDETITNTESEKSESEEPESEDADDQNADVRKEVEELLDLNIDEYESTGHVCGGVIPVYNESKWGALNYNGVEIIPCEYDGYICGPNKDGYIVMFKGDENAEYTLFDNTGKTIYQGPEHIVASNGFYIIARGDEENGQTNTFIDYYHYDGTLVTSVDTQSPGDWGVSWEPHGFYDGLSLVERNMGSVVYSRSDQTAVMPFDVGFVNEGGSVDWHDGDGFDETDYSEVMGYEEYTSQATAANSTNSNTGQAYGAMSVANESIPMNSLNNGYYLAYYEFSGERVLRDKDHIVAAVMMDMITLQDDALIYGKDSVSAAGNSFPIYGSDSETYYDENRILAYPSDGDWYYNYGSKILMYINGKYVLMDLLSSEELKYNVFDYCEMSDENYWLVQSGDRWGYIDHEGEIKALFEDAGAFHNGVAPIVEGKMAYLIDENFEKVQELGEADSVYCAGEIFVINKDGNKRLFALK